MIKKTFEFCSDRSSDKSFENRLRRACSEHREIGERVQGIVGSSEAHREAWWLDDDESQVSIKLKIYNVPLARWIRFLVISSNFVTRSFSRELLKFSKDPFNVRRKPATDFFFRDGTGSVPNGATINYRKRISSFQARTSFPTFFNFSPFFSSSLYLFYFTPIASPWIFRILICSSPSNFLLI